MNVSRETRDFRAIAKKVWRKRKRRRAATLCGCVIPDENICRGKAYPPGCYYERTLGGVEIETPLDEPIAAPTSRVLP